MPDRNNTVSAQRLAEIYENIRFGREVRKNLIELRAAVSDASLQRKFAYLLGGNFDTLTDLLQNPDPKIRKNTALILGEMETEDILPFLFTAYLKEETRFIRADYLKAMGKLNCGRYLSKLRERRDALLTEENDEESRKHIREELLALDALLKPYEKSRGHVLKGMNEGDGPESQTGPLPTVLLVTGTLNREVTAGAVKTGEVKLLHSAVRVSGGNLQELLAIRTYKEMLFPVPTREVLAGKNEEEIGKKLAELKLPAFLDGLHDREDAYRYRLDIRGLTAGADKGKMVRRISEALDRFSRGRLLNSASGYEVELRLLARKDGGFVPMLKLMTIPDKRFSYRKEVLADSIHPTTAALAVQLAKPYLRENAQVLDPFCGTGTMLIERRYALGASDTYGVDYLGEAIEKARTNTEIAGMMIHYVQRDFFGFKHDYRFDEVITNMPARGAGDMDAETLYDRFFMTLPSLMNSGAVLVLITSRPDLVRRFAPVSAGYRVREEYLLNEKTQSTLIVLGYGKQI